MSTHATFLLISLRNSWIRNPISKFLSKHFGKDNVNAYPNFLAQVNDRILRRRAQGNSERRDMLQQFFEAKTDKGEPISHADVLSEAANVLGAGADTTSIGIKACLGYLMLNPKTYQQLQRDIDSYCAEYAIEAKDLTYNRCLELPLLQAVVKER
jgi:cytochrome P450